MNGKGRKCDACGSRLDVRGHCTGSKETALLARVERLEAALRSARNWIASESESDIEGEDGPAILDQIRAALAVSP